MFFTIFAEVVECKRRLAAHLLDGVPGQIDAAWLTLALHPGSDVDAVTKNVSPSMMMSPTLIPMRKTIWDRERPLFRSAIPS